jgi:hypothetical protein
MADLEDIDIFDVFKIDRHALHYFGILRFTDMPGFFPKLEYPDEETPTVQTVANGGSLPIRHRG